MLGVGVSLYARLCVVETKVEVLSAQVQKLSDKIDRVVAMNPRIIRDMLDAAEEAKDDVLFTNDTEAKRRVKQIIQSAARFALNMCAYQGWKPDEIDERITSRDFYDTDD